MESSRSHARITGLAIALLAAAAAAPARAAIFELTIDPAQSWIQVTTAQSGLRFTTPGPFVDTFVAVGPQSGPGIAGETLPGGFVSDGTRSSLSGTIRADVRPTQVTFLTNSTLVTIGTFGAFLPGTDTAPATPAPANLAVSFEEPLFGLGGDLVLRNGKFSMFGQNLPISPTATPGLFTFTPSFSLTPFWMDGRYTSEVNGVVSSFATPNIQPFAQNLVVASFEELPGERLRLTLPLNLTGQPFGFPIVSIPLPADLQVRATGQIVATAPEAEGGLVGLGALLALGWMRRARTRRGALRVAGVLFLAGTACTPSYWREQQNLESSNRAAQSAEANIDVENGTLADGDASAAAPDATAEASVAGTVNAQEVTATSTAERTERPLTPSQAWALRVNAHVVSEGGLLDFDFDGAVTGSFNYSIRDEGGEGPPAAIPITFETTVISGDPSDVYEALATADCDGLGPVPLVANDTAAVDIDPLGAGPYTGSCLVSLSHEGSRTGVATTNAQRLAEVYFPALPFQSTLTACTALDPENPFPVSTGGCGNGIGTACLNDAHCADGHYCNFGCLDGSDGDACEADEQCRSLSGQQDWVCTLGKCGAASAECDPVAQTGCDEGEKCDNVAGDSPQGVTGGVTRCAADGLVVEGEACTALSTTPSSSCAAGTTCEDGVCQRWCRTAAECDGGDACDVSKGPPSFGPARDLPQGDGGRCKSAATCLGCR